VAAHAVPCVLFDEIEHSALESNLLRPRRLPGTKQASNSCSHTGGHCEGAHQADPRSGQAWLASGQTHQWPSEQRPTMIANSDGQAESFDPNAARQRKRSGPAASGGLDHNRERDIREG
jgi:hypothetical protein